MYPCENADAVGAHVLPSTRATDLMRSMRDAETGGDEIVAVWHSHTHTDAYPSPTDVEQAMEAQKLDRPVALPDREPEVRRTGAARRTGIRDSRHHRGAGRGRDVASQPHHGGDHMRTRLPADLGRRPPHGPARPVDRAGARRSTATRCRAWSASSRATRGSSRAATRRARSTGVPAPGARPTSRGSGVASKTSTRVATTPRRASRRSTSTASTPSCCSRTGSTGSSTPTDRDFHLTMTRIYNDHLSSFCAYAPDRFGGAALAARDRRRRRDRRGRAPRRRCPASSRSSSSATRTTRLHPDGRRGRPGVGGDRRRPASRSPST